jgi:hypothetical protein
MSSSSLVKKKLDLKDHLDEAMHMTEKQRRLSDELDAESEMKISASHDVIASTSNFKFESSKHMKSGKSSSAGPDSAAAISNRNSDLVSSSMMILDDEKDNEEIDLSEEIDDEKSFSAMPDFGNDSIKITGFNRHNLINRFSLSSSSSTTSNMFMSKPVNLVNELDDEDNKNESLDKKNDSADLDDYAVKSFISLSSAIDTTKNNETISFLSQSQMSILNQNSVKAQKSFLQRNLHLNQTASSIQDQLMDSIEEDL